MNTYTIVKNPCYKKGQSNGYTILKNGVRFCGYQSHSAAQCKLKELQNESE